MLAGAQRRAFARAFRGGGSNAWLVAATAIWLLRTANRLRRPQPARVVYLEPLAPGERLVIDHLPPPSRGGTGTRRRRS